jgi:hypothetical protein
MTEQSHTIAYHSEMGQRGGIRAAQVALESKRNATAGLLQPLDSLPDRV